MRSSSHLRYLTWFQKNLRPRQNLRSCLFYLIRPTLQLPLSPHWIHLECEAILMWQKHQEPTLKWPNTHHSIIYFTKEGLSLATPRQLIESALAVSGPMLHALPAHALIILTASLKGTYYLQSSLLSSVRRLGSEPLRSQRARVIWMPKLCSDRSYSLKPYGKSRKDDGMEVILRQRSPERDCKSISEQMPHQGRGPWLWIWGSAGQPPL